MMPKVTVCHYLFLLAGMLAGGGAGHILCRPQFRVRWHLDPEYGCETSTIRVRDLRVGTTTHEPAGQGLRGHGKSEPASGPGAPVVLYNHDLYGKDSPMMGNPERRTPLQ